MLQPATIDELREAVRSHDRVLAVGARTKPRLSVVNGDTALIDTTALTGITEYDPHEYTFTALAGTPASEVEKALAAEGQFLPFAPLLRGGGATLGGTAASGFGGPGRFRFGGVRDFLLGVRFVDGEGKLVTAGAPVVKNTAGFDVPKFMVGSLGRFGVLAELTFKVFPVSTGTLTVRVPCDSARLATERIVAASTSRWELQALDYVPGDERIYMRIAGPADANEHIARDIADTWDSALTRLAPDEEAAFWDRVRELRWSEGAEVLLKVPITPREIAPLEEALAAVHGTTAYYSVGGNVAHIALEKTGHAGDLDRALRQLDLRGLAFRGEKVPLWFGDHPEFTITKAIKHTFDPKGRFPDL